MAFVFLFVFCYFFKLWKAKKKETVETGHGRESGQSE
jgi:hypothetical protein